MSNNFRLGLLVLLAIFISAGVSGFALLNWFSAIKQDWSRMATRIQVDADHDRTIAPILAELALVDQMIHGEPFEAWLDSPNDTVARDAAIAYLNDYRLKLDDQSYFVVLAKNEDYYYNNASGEFTGRELRYSLNRHNPDDAWFYSGLELDRDLALNVDFDRGLGVVKLWINQRVYDEDGPAGIAGTGFDLPSFLSEYVRANETDFRSVFTNRIGAVQLSNRGQDIQYGAIGNPFGAKYVIFDEATTPEDHDKLEALFNQAAASPGEVLSDEIVMSGERELVGVAFFPTLNWFEVTRIDADRVLHQADTLQLYLVVGGAIVLALLVVFVGLSTWVFNPLTNLIQIARAPAPEVDSLKPLLTRLGGDYGEVGRRLVELSRRQRDLSEKEAQLQTSLQQALESLSVDRFRDEVTGLLSPTSLKQAVEAACGLVERVNIPVTVIMVRPVGEFGRGGELWRNHANTILRELAASLDALAGTSTDQVGRVNDSDLAVLMPGIDREAAEAEMARLVRELAFVEIKLSESEVELPLKVVAGFETVSDVAHAKPERLLRRAEQAVHIAEHTVLAAEASAVEVAASAELDIGNTWR